VHTKAQQCTIGPMLARADQRSVGQLADMRFAVSVGLTVLLAVSGGALAAYPLPSGYRYPNPPGSACWIAVRCPFFFAFPVQINMLVDCLPIGKPGLLFLSLAASAVRSVRLHEHPDHRRASVRHRPQHVRQRLHRAVRQHRHRLGGRLPQLRDPDQQYATLAPPDLFPRVSINNI